MGGAQQDDATIPAVKGDPLSTTALPELHAPSEPVRGRLERALNYARRHATVGGLLLWAAAGAVFAVHATGVGLPDPTRFAMLDSWLIGLGCVGCPLMAVRDLGRRINLQVFAMISVFCVALAILLTALILGGSLRDNTLDDTFALILALAGAIQLFNAYDGELHARRREVAARQAGREAALSVEVDARYRALSGLERLGQKSVDELVELAGIIDGIIQARRSDYRPLHLVATPGSRSQALRQSPPADSLPAQASRDAH